MSRFAIVELHKEDLTFSAGHFMVFSPTERETMHGHDYQVNVAFHTLIERNGLSFDLRYYKQKLLQLCQSLDYHFILPQYSEYLRLEDKGDTWLVHVTGDTISFLKRDAMVLPICNVTLEEVSNWFLEQLIQNSAELKAHKIGGIKVCVYNGRNQSAATCWGELATLQKLPQFTNTELA